MRADGEPREPRFAGASTGSVGCWLHGHEDDCGSWPSWGLVVSPAGSLLLIHLSAAREGNAGTCTEGGLRRTCSR